MTGPPIGADRVGRGTISRDAMWSVLYMGVVRLATAGLSILVARRIGSAGAGAFGIVLQVCALGSMLAAFNLPQGLTKKLAEATSREERRLLLRTAWRLVPFLGVVVGTTLSVSSGWLGAGIYHDPALNSILFWCGPLILATTCSQLVEGALQGLGRFVSLARWASVVSVLDLVGGVVGTLWGVAGVVVSRSLIRAGATVYALRAWLRRGGETMRPDMPATDAPGATHGPVAGLLRFSGPAFLSAVIVLACQTVLRLLLVRRSVLDQAGYFHAADTIAQGLLLIPSAVSLALMPAVSRMRGAVDAQLGGALRHALERVAGINLALCLVFIGLAPWVMRILFGAAFLPAGRVAVLLAATYGFAGPCTVLGAALLGRGEVWRAVVLNLVWAVVVLMAYGLTPEPWGALGAAAAVGVGYVALTLLYVVWIVPAWKVVSEVLPSVFATFVSLGLAAASALCPGVPPGLTFAICILLGLAIAWRWGLPGLSADIRDWLQTR